MGNLTSCLKKLGTAVAPADKANVISRSRALRDQGMSVGEAALKAVRDVFEEVRAELKALSPAASAQQQAGGDPAGIDSRPTKPRLAESPDMLMAKLRELAAGFVAVGTGRGIVPVYARNPAGGPIYAVESNGRVSVIGSGGRTRRDATVAEVAEFNQELEGDRLWVQAYTRWGGSGSDTDSKPLQELHSPSGMSWGRPATPSAEDQDRAQAKAQAREQALQVRRTEREAERSVFRDLATNPELVGMSLNNVETLVHAKAGDSIAPDKRARLAKALVAQVAKRAAELERQRHRDPAVREAAIKQALQARLSEDPAAEHEAAFRAGFEHALRGGSRSTLSGELILRKGIGYDAGKAWMSTEEGAAWAEGRAVNKLQNTGMDLRRWYEQLQSQMKVDESDIDKAWKQIERATARADLFATLLPDGVTPGYRTYVETVRNNVRPFKAWLERNRQFDWAGYTAYRLRSSRSDKSNLEYIVAGQRYPGSLPDAQQQQFQTDPGFRAQWLRDQATEYLRQVRAIVEVLEGTSSVGEAAAKWTERYLENDPDPARGESFAVKFSPAGQALYGSPVWDGRASDLTTLRTNSPVVQAWIDKENTMERPTRATPIVAPRLDKVERDGPDVRKGRDVTPQEFKDTFGLADVGFGKWVGAAEDQAHLNYAFDAFTDLAKHFGISQSSVGFGGALHFTVGALGRGKHAAHFSPNQPSPEGPVPVINVTNTKGDGTLYHEWGHALDHFLSGDWNRVRTRVLDILSKGPLTAAQVERTARRFLVGGYRWKGNARQGKVDSALYAMQRSDVVYGTTSAYKLNADKLGKDYWGNEQELLARAIEAWAFDTLGHRSDYLVSEWVADGKVTQEAGYRGTPYPTGEERKLFNQVINALAKATTWEDGRPRVTMAAFDAALPDELTAGPRRRAELSDRKAMQAYYEQLQAEAADKAAANAQEAADAVAAEQQRLDELAAQKLRELHPPAPATVDTPPASERDGPLTEDDLSAIFDEAAAELREEQQEQPDAPAPGETITEPVNGWTAQDWEVIQKHLDAGRPVLLAEEGHGIPTIHEFGSKGQTDMVGFGVFRTTGDGWTASWDGGGAMDRTPSGKAYTVVSVTRGTLPESVYDLKAAQRAGFDGMSQASPEHWWDKSLASAGRLAFLNRAGIVLPDRVLWRHVSPNNQAALTAIRSSGFDPDAAPRLAKLTRDDILEALRNGHVAVGPFKVRIEQLPSRHYVAKVTAPDFNTVIETPRTVDAEGPLAFYERVADRLMDMLGAQPAANPGDMTQLERDIAASGRGKDAPPAASKNRSDPLALIRKHFTPGNVVPSYGGHDEVLEFKETEGGFKVHVHGVVKQDGQWVRVGKPQDARWHSTRPEARDVKAGPVDQLQADQPIVYSEPRADGAPFPHAHPRGGPGEPDQAGTPAAEQTAAQLIAKAAALGVKGADEALTGLAKLFGTKPGRLNSFPAGFDEDTYKEAKPHFEKALASFQEAGRTLKEFFKFLIQELGDGVKMYAVQFAKDRGLSNTLGAKEQDSSMGLADWVKARVSVGHSFDWRLLFAKADELFGGTQAEGKYTPKDAYDAIEAGINLHVLQAGQRYSGTLTEEEAQLAVAALQRKLDLVPTQTKRTAEQTQLQQFSTVPTLAFVANWVAKVGPTDVVLEPSAGLGGLAAFAKASGAKVVLNELSARRAALLQQVFPDARVFREDAEFLHNILPDDVVPTVVVMNPPFSNSTGGLKDTMVGARHVEQALQRLPEGGRLVAIVGEGMAMDRPAFKDWWKKIGAKYDVRAAVPMDGSGYAKYGTTFDNVLLVIDKVKPSGRKAISTKVKDYTELVHLLAEVRDDRPSPNVARQDHSTEPDARGADGARAAVGDGVPGQPSAGDGVPAGVGAGQPGPVAGVGRGGAAGGGAGRGQRPRGAAGDDRSVQPGGEQDQNGSGQGDAQRDGQPGTAGRESGVTVATGQVAAGELTDAVFEGYQPQRLQVPGARAHPGPLVQSAAMASVLPPVPSYTPNLPKEAVEGGLLSVAQIEAVVYAGQAHAQLLEDKVGDTEARDFGLKPGTPYRRGFFVGDGTGVGKGREISGILLDNIRQGRKRHIWISEKQGLMQDAARDLAGIQPGATAEQVLKSGALFNLGKTKAADSVADGDGILFTTYSTLRSGAKSADDKAEARKAKTRVDQIVEWAGADFDGVIAFDEAHNAGNATAMKGERGTTEPSAQALAVVELQRRLPNARVVYVSATGATEVSNLSFATRLGLWGVGTPFASVHDFVAQMTAGGLATMELVARDLKQTGAYMARSLSFDGVSYSRLEHELSPLQHDIYNRMADAWQVVLNNIEEALKVVGVVSESGRTKNSKAKAAAMSAFWGGQQRFFNQIITSMQMPSVVESIEADLAAGHAVVLQLVNTNEAQQERAVAKRREQDEDADLDGLDLTPRDQIIDMVRKSFPVQQYMDEVDGEGKRRTVEVLDSNGAPVLNKTAVAMRDKLIEDLQQIQVPDGPLEILVNHFGPEVVAEVTGRKQRVVSGRWNKSQKGAEDGEPRAFIDKRGPAAARADSIAFMADKKQVLVFSDAGGTGFSFHADLTKANQRKRQHYLIQPGWRANKAVQGLGRSHRTNQASAPHYRLVATNIPAHKRFLSSIARRLDQLGALTKGQRDTSSGGLFSEKDNLESKYAERAVRAFLFDAKAGQIEGLDFAELLQQLGLKDLLDPTTKQISESKVPPVRLFLNRLLSLKLELQDTVFNGFIARMEELVEQAAERGELDTGMQTIRALESKVTHDEVVYTDERTGAETSYVELALTHPTRMHQFPSEKAQGGKIEWLVNVKSGRAWGRLRSGNQTLKSGAVVERFRMLSTGGMAFRSAEDFRDAAAWKKVTEDQARELWAKENAARPPTYTTKTNLIVGAMLPIWDRLKTEGTMQVARTQTTDGRRLLGRVIHEKDIAEIRRRLNVAAPESKLPPAEVMARVLKGEVAELANGWKLERARVSDDLRVEIKGLPAAPGQGLVRELTEAGAIQERIGWQTRYFVPVASPDVLAALTKARPVIGLARPDETPKLKRGDGHGVDVVELRRMVAEIAANWAEGGPLVAVLDHARELPASIYASLVSMGAQDTTRGLMMPDGRVFLIASKLASLTEAKAILFHEVYGHVGMRAYLGDRYEAQMTMLRMANPTLAAEANTWYANYADGQIAARVQRGMSRQDAEKVVRLLAVEEALADRAGDAPPPSGWKSLMAALQTGLRRMGLGEVADMLERMTEAETHALLMNARRAVQRRGGPVHALSGLPATMQPKRDDANPVASQRPAREAAAWNRIEHNTEGPEFYGNGVGLVAIQQLSLDDFAPDHLALPMGHAVKVRDGHTVHRFLITNADASEVLGQADLELDPDGHVEAIHDVVVDDKGRGTGRRVVEAVLASAPGQVRLLDIVQGAEAFWDRMGAGYKDVYGDATTEWSALKGQDARAAPRTDARVGQGLEGQRAAEAGRQGGPADSDAAGSGEAAGDAPVLSQRPPVLESALRKAGIGRPRTLKDKIRGNYGRAVEAVRDRGEIADQVRQGTLDQFYGIQRATTREIGNLPVEQNPYVTARLANGGTSSVMRALMLHGQARWAANGQHLEKVPGTVGLLDILKPLGNDLNDWFGWMVGNRAARLMAEGRENNLSKDEIKALQDLATPERKAAFQKAALEYAAFKRSVLDVAQGAGLIDAESRRAWDHADYIPFYREVDERSLFSPTGRKGLAGQSSGIRQLKGGESDLNDPMENLLMNFSRLIDASLKNNAIRKTIETLKDAGSDLVHKVGYDMKPALVPRSQVVATLAQAGTPESIIAVLPDEVFDGIAKMWAIQAPADPDVVRVMVGGKPQFYRVHDGLLLQALTSFVPFDFPGLALMRGAKRLLTATVTSTPQFMASNWTRDSLAAQAITHSPFNPLESIKGIGRAYRESGGYEAMLFAGASFQSGNVNAGDPESTAIHMRRALRERGMDASSVNAFMGSLVDYTARGWEKYRTIGEAIENANREAVYEAAGRAGKSATEAAFEAKDLMDFSLRGSWAGYQLLADVLPFFNARVQGLYRLGRSDPKRLMMVGTLMMAATAALAVANGGEDWYERLPDWDKDGFWHIRVGGQHFRIPKPFELGVLFATLPERIGRGLVGLDSGKKTLGRVWANVRDQLAFDPVPQLIRPGLDAWANKDSFRDRPIEGMADEGKSPSARYDARTSDTMRVLANAAEPISDWSGLSPKKLEFLVNGYFGTVGMYGLAVADAVVRSAEGKPARPELRDDDLPVVRAFYAVDPARSTVFESDIYKMREQVEQVVREMNALAKSQDKADRQRAKEMMAREMDKLKARGVVSGTAKAMSSINQQISQVYMDPAMTPAEKRQRIDTLQEKKNAMAQKAATNPKVKAAF